MEPAFVSLAQPDVTSALERAARLGARRSAVVSYFLFTGRLVDRIGGEVADWAAGGPVHVNCDGCLYRAPLPGYEHRVAAPPFGSPPATMAAGGG